jgi:hypothetical protein
MRKSLFKSIKIHKNIQKMPENSGEIAKKIGHKERL